MTAPFSAVPDHAPVPGAGGDAPGRPAGHRARLVAGHRFRRWSPAVKASGTAALLVLGLLPFLIAGPAQAGAGAAPVAAAAWPTPRLTRLVALAKAQTTKNIPYEASGGHGPTPASLDSPVDCSGLVRELYKAAFDTDIGSGSGDSMVRTSGLFTKTGHPVPGDVILLGQGGRGPAYHAMIFVGMADGRPVAVGSPETGEDIKYQYPSGAYWSGDVMGYWHYNRATAGDSGPVEPPAATGKIEYTHASKGHLQVSGWAFDQANPFASNSVDVVVDGRVAWHGVAANPRSDVNRTYEISGRHGFDVTVAASPGPHRVSITSSGLRRTTGIGTRRVAVPVPALGAVSARVDSGNGDVRFTGWAVDPDHPADATTGFALVVDGRQVYRGRTVTLRSDVNAGVHVRGRHGFDVTLPLKPGRHTMTLTVFGSASSSGLSARSFTDAVQVAGRSEFVKAVPGGKILVSGWTYDRQAADSSNSVQVYLDGRLTTLTAGLDRPDVNHGLHIPGHHGYSVLLPATAGRHSIVVVAKARVAHSLDRRLDSRTVTVG